MHGDVEWHVQVTAGLLYYPVLIIWGLCAQRRWVFILSYTILCVSLLIDIACLHFMLHHFHPS